MPFAVFGQMTCVLYLCRMEQLTAQLNAYRKEIESATAANPEELESFRIRFLGSKGLVKTVMGEMKHVAPENRKEAGQLLNDFKLFTEASYEKLKAGIQVNGQASASAGMDTGLPGYPLPLEAVIRSALSVTTSYRSSSDWDLPLRKDRRSKMTGIILPR